MTIDDAFAAIGRVPQAAAVDTSMQTDTYDADALSEYTTDETVSSTPTEDETAPLELSDWMRPEPPATTSRTCARTTTTPKRRPATPCAAGPRRPDTAR